MYSLIKIRHTSLIQCHGNFSEVEIFYYMLEIDISRNYTQKDLGVLKGDIGGFVCPNDAQMPCWLRL